ncbi:MAG TPA: AAA-like domain-containing protein [Woeseiaceae bacterium]|nr:AAA-like domain-containing protein [Woeseiaceae bacterium]
MSDSPQQNTPGKRSKLDSTGEFFSVGTPLHAVRAGYIRRRADDLLYEAAIAGRYAHIIAPGRSGKSSLIAATAARLEHNGVRVAILDLAQIGAREGAQDAGRWYYNVAYRLLRQLRIRVDLQTWWQDKSVLSNRQRLVELFAELILGNVEQPVVVFVDGLQCIAELPSADQMLTSIRAAHNARVTDPAFNGLTFILSGECDPQELVSEADASPFHVSQPIPLDDFTRKDLQIFATELNLGADDAIEALDRIFYWTRGQPYLSQKLARAVAREVQAGNINAQVDRITAQQLTGKAALTNEPHLSYVHRQIVARSKQREKLLNLYGRIRKGITVQADLGSPLHRRLMAIGLLEVDETGELRVRNRIYESLFTARWANENMRVQWRAPTLVAAAILLVIAVPFAYTQLLPKPYARALSSPASTLIDAESSWQNLRSFPGHAAGADNLFRHYLTQAAANSTSAGEILAIASLAEALPDAGSLPQQLQADFWDRRRSLAARAELRDDALLASLQSLILSTPERRNRAAALVGQDYPLLLASVVPPASGQRIFDPVNLLLTSVVAGKLHQWQYNNGVFSPRAPWSLTALEVRPLVRRVVVDQQGITRRLGLTLNISHPRFTDLRLKLIAPSGRAVEIKLDVPSASSNDDLKVPARILQPLVGESLTGTWTLSLRDEATGVAGHLVGWNLNLNGQVLEEGFQRGISIPDPIERETDQFWTSIDGQFAVARAAQSDSARIWSLALAKPLATIPINVNERLVGLDANAQQLVTATRESVSTWDIDSGVRIATLPVGQGSASASLTPDRQHLFVQRHGDFETEFELWDLGGGSPPIEFIVAGVPGIVALDADGQHIAIADYDRAVRVWDFGSGELLAQLDLPLQPTHIELDASGRTLGAMFGRAGLSVWQIDAAGQPLLEEFGDGNWQFRFSPTGARMVAGRGGSGFQVYSTADGSLLGPPLGLVGETGALLTDSPLYFGSDEDLLVTGGPNAALRLWQIPDGRPAHEASDDLHMTWSPAGDAIAATLPDLSALAIADRSGHVHLRAINGEAVAVATADEDISFLGHNRAVRLLATSPGGDLLASVGADNSIRVWASSDGRPKEYMEYLPGSPIQNIAFSPDGELLGILVNNRVHILATSNGATVLDLELGTTHTAIAFRDANSLYVGSESGAVKIISRDSVTGWNVQHMWQGDSAIRYLVASPRGDVLLVVDDDRQVQQFDLKEGRLATMVVTLPSRVHDVVFSPSGSRVLVRTSRWVHRLGSSANGLLWLDAMFVPRPLHGAKIVFGELGQQTNGNDFYLPVARDNGAQLRHFKFDDDQGAGLFGSHESLLRTWQQRLGRVPLVAREAPPPFR